MATVDELKQAIMSAGITAAFACTEATTAAMANAGLPVTLPEGYTPVDHADYNTAAALSSTANNAMSAALFASQSIVALETVFPTAPPAP